MAKIICLFNHKGGVSKTTTAFNLGWMMAMQGRRVLIADFDPQCNLTGMVMGFGGIEDLAALYSSTPPNNIRDGLAPAFESQPKQIVGVECHRVSGNENLLLLPGHIGLAEYENSLGVAQQLGGSLLPLRNLPGSIRYLLDRTSEKYAIDYVLVDMSPSLGPLNQNLISTSDYFIVPLNPDYFSSMALQSLAVTLPRWKTWAEDAARLEVLMAADYPFPPPHSTFLGAIVQKYRPRSGKPSQAFQKWFDQLTDGLRDVLVPSLTKANMLDVGRYRALVGHDPWVPLMEASDFNSLIAFSQEHHVPIYSLTQAQTRQVGNVWDQTKASMETFRAAFSTCAERVFALTA